MEKRTHDRGSKFLKDLGIYAIGNLGSKIITFAMMAVYTFFTDTSDFGYYDLCFSAILLLLSFFTLQLRDGVLRFMLESDNFTRHSQIVTFIYRTLLSNTVVFLGITILLAVFTNIDYLWYTFGLLVVMSFYEVVTQVARGLKKNHIFMATGIISSLFIAIFGIIFVCFMKMGIEGIFLSNILARIVALLFLETKLKVVKNYFNIKIDCKQLGKEILRFSIPLMPSAICWWFTAGSDRWFISSFVGLDANGIYSIAVRFMGIIQILATIYYQAWQETAILQYNSPTATSFSLRCSILTSVCLPQLSLPSSSCLKSFTLTSLTKAIRKVSYIFSHWDSRLYYLLLYISLTWAISALKTHRALFLQSLSHQ